MISSNSAMLLFSARNNWFNLILISTLSSDIFLGLGLKEVFENSFLTTGLKDWGLRLVASKEERVEEDKSTKSESLGELTVLLTVFILDLKTFLTPKFGTKKSLHYHIKKWEIAGLQDIFWHLSWISSVHSGRSIEMVEFWA